MNLESFDAWINIKRMIGGLIYNHIEAEFNETEAKFHFCLQIDDFNAHGSPV